MALSYGPEELVPLYSYEAEMSTLGSMILSERAAEEVVTILDENDFYRPSHRLIFKAMKQLIHQHKPIDLVTLRAELMARGNLADIGGEDYLVQVAEFVPSPANSGYYAGIVLDKATLRRLDSAGHEIRGVVHDPEGGTVDDKVDKAEQLVFEVGRKQLGKYFQHVRTLAKEFFVDVDNIVESGKPMSGLKVGFFDLDRMTTGHYPGDFVVIGARPAMGKTSLVLDFALNVARDIVRNEQKGSVAVFSLEMSSIQLVRRMASMLSGVSSSVLKQDKPITDWQYERLADACETLYGLPIFVDDASDVTPLEMRGKCRRLKAEHGLSMVVVDYLQLMKGGRRTENRVQEISEIARACKAMAKELEVPVIALSQLSRAVENRDDKRPQLSDIRESGSIEAEADLVMLLYRDSYYKAKEEHRPETENADEVQESEIIIAKHRNGPTGKVILGFQPSYARYRNLDRTAYRSAKDDE
ncbi:replicative DNA helicase [Fimbriimonas ginsengisoli]|uniref:Replicative DNA helicase n=1 Tax=Fimbriimonas ginsengisoli Gsoil 348 TaxID=661478 RepID=A0A068NTW8_FIMGI|nr:replicative DNA helicase [Fimbriimonas ginsengisoli]AIE86812.1 primary replicative DNA helicase [Fimbriimonas ginsengisoli Gsoil 348]